MISLNISSWSVSQAISIWGGKKRKHSCICSIDHAWFIRCCICKSFNKDELWCHRQLRKGSVWILLHDADRLLILPSHISFLSNQGLVFIKLGLLMVMSLAFSKPYWYRLQYITLRILFPQISIKKVMYLCRQIHILWSVFFILKVDLSSGCANC